MEKDKKINPEKIKQVEQLVNLINENNTIFIASIKGLPASQFQEIKKKLHEKAKIKVMKNTVMLRALDSSKKSGIDKLKEYIDEGYAILFSKLDPFELSGILSENKSPVKAKIGQESNEDIRIEAGPTELAPGPIISELGGLGLQFEIKEGKIEIKQGKTIVKKGEKVSEAAASIMNKLDIKPFFIGFIPLAAYDSESGKVYKEIKVDREKTIEELKELFNKSKAFAIAFEYPAKEIIGFLLVKAAEQEKALNRLIKEEKKEVEKLEEENEEKTEEIKKEKVEEKKKEENIQKNQENKLEEK